MRRFNGRGYASFFRVADDTTRSCQITPLDADGYLPDYWCYGLLY
jgi:hypothetical protein